DVGDVTSARPLIEEALTAPRRGQGALLGELVLCLMAEVHLQEGDLPAARTFAERVMATARAAEGHVPLGSDEGPDLAMVLLHQGDLATARAFRERSLALAREEGDAFRIAWALTRLGEVAHTQEDYPVARDLFEQSLSLWRELGHKSRQVATLHQLG